jgi:hypothetical protein
LGPETRLPVRAGKECNQRMRPLSLLILGLLACRAVFAGVVRVEVTERSDVVMPANTGAAGPYERIVGKVHFALDPRLPANRLISDIDLAPRNAQGLVEFTSDMYVFQPKDPRRGNGTVLFQVANRGRKDLMVLFNRGAVSNDPRTLEEIGDGFLLDRGFTLAWIGWQFDIPAEGALLRFHVPVARNGNAPITGLIRADFVPDERSTQIGVGDRNHIPYPVANPDDPALQLTVRDRRDGPRTTIPRAQWKLDEGRTNIVMAAGFEPGKIYELVYQAKDPALVGLGPAAIRDYIAHLKQNRATTGIERAIGIGSSQTGRFLRTFLYFGFNQDEKGAQVFDGVWAHVAGAGRGSFNHRFAQPSRDARPYFNFFYPTDLFPFTDASQTDAVTGLTEGLLDRVEKAGVRPKIFYTNGAYEYFGRAASLIHTTVDGKADLAPQPNTRIYFVPGSQHGPATAFPPTHDVLPVKNGLQNWASTNDYRWAMRGLLVAMNNWITKGTEPPASAYPRFSTQQLVPLNAIKFPKIPGVKFPTRIHDAFALEYGPEFRSKGIVSIEPAKVGPRYPVFLSQVDADGNEVAGIRMPWLQVPLATHTGWNLRHPSIGAPEELFSFGGSTIPLAKTRAEREKTGDPRLSIAERYSSRDDYLAKTRTAAKALASGRFVLESDVDGIVAQAGTHWDHWAK